MRAGEWIGGVMVARVRWFAAAILALLVTGCGGEDFDAGAYRSAVQPLVTDSVVGNMYRARLLEVGKGDVRVQLDFTRTPDNLLIARRAMLGYCERLVSSIHEKLDPEFPSLTFASCRGGRDRGSMRDVYGAVRYGKSIGFKIQDK